MSTSAHWIPKPVAVPALHDARSTWLTYELFYGLREKPFSLSSDPSFFYGSCAHAKAFEDLESGIRRRESLSVVTGDIGTGKTTLCRAVLQKLDRKTFSAFVSDPFASRKDMLKVVLIDFGVVSAGDFTSGRLKDASRTELSYLLYEFLDSLTPLEAFAVLFIDEAQNLSLPLLEEIRILSDSHGCQRQLQVVLVGQLELRDKLQLREMRQVDQRISMRCHLEPLDREGVAGYVAHRLLVVGGSPDRISFSADAIDAVYEGSGGVPRVINRLCDHALHRAHLEQAAIVDAGFVRGPRPVIEPASSPVEMSINRMTSYANEPVDRWLADYDDVVATGREPSVLAALGIDEAMVRPEAQEGHREKATRLVPLTHMEILTRTWLRRLQLGAVFAVAIAGMWLALACVWAVVSPPVAVATPPPVPEATRPDLNASPPATYSIELPPRRPGESARRLGPYANRDEAESEAARLRRIRGYKGARTVETGAPVSSSAVPVPSKPEAKRIRGR